MRSYYYKCCASTEATFNFSKLLLNFYWYIQHHLMFYIPFLNPQSSFSNESKNCYKIFLPL